MVVGKSMSQSRFPLHFVLAFVVSACLATLAFAQYGTSESPVSGTDSAKTETAQPEQPNEQSQSTAKPEEQRTQPTESDPTARRALADAKQHERDEQFMRLLLIGVGIFFSAIAFAGYLSIPKRQKEQDKPVE